MRVLVIATRDLGGLQTGRKAVLRTILSTLRSLGCELEVVILARRQPEFALDPPRGVRVHHVRPPGVGAVALRVVTHGLRRARSLNECLYEGPRQTRQISAIAKRAGCDLVVADMIRTAELAFSTGLPVVLDLDDLLSQRYREQASDADPATVLGYHRDNLPAVAARVGGRLARRMLRLEASILARRERSCGRRAAAVSLVSPREGAAFERSLDRPVAWLPMAVDVQADAASVATNGPVLLFTASLAYEPNRQALRWYVREVAPHLAHRGARLDVIGAATDEVRAELESDAVRFVGYVDDLWATLRTGRAFLAPIVSGTGVKTKVLEALAVGLPVVSTSKGVEGIEVTHLTSALIADDGAAFAAHVEHVLDDPHGAARIGAAGQRLVAAGYSTTAVAERWADVLERVAGEVTVR